MFSCTQPSPAHRPLPPPCTASPAPSQPWRPSASLLECYCRGTPGLLLSGARATVPNAGPEHLAHRQGCVIPARMPRPGHPDRECLGHPGLVRRPALRWPPVGHRGNLPFAARSTHGSGVNRVDRRSAPATCRHRPVWEAVLTRLDPAGPYRFRRFGFLATNPPGRSSETAVPVAGMTSRRSC